MKNLGLLIVILLTGNILWSQVGIGTTTPEGMLDIKSNDLGIVVPRVSDLKNVTDGNGNDAVDGTIVYDITNEKMCYRIAGSWICIGKNNAGQTIIGETNFPIYSTLTNYIKASNTGQFDTFGFVISLSGDGSRLAVGAFREDSNATGIGGDQADNNASSSGAVYVFSKSGGIWSQEAYIKASNTEANDNFGYSLSLNSDGSRLVVGAYGEDSNATGINGNQADNNASGSGAIYVFSRTGTTWSQEAYIKASNTEANDSFGSSLSLNSDSTRLVVGAYTEKSNATGIGGNQADNNASNSGAVYVFSRSGTTWSQEAYIKASNTEANDYFGSSLSLNSDSTRLVVGANGEDSIATGINGSQADNSASSSGAVYVFSRSGTTWSQEAYIKASNTEANDYFGYSIDVSSDGFRLAVGAYREDSNAIEVGNDPTDNTATDSGAIYVYSRSGTTWSQEAYVKASNTETDDNFGYSVSLNTDGSRLVVGAYNEDSNATGINGDYTSNSGVNSGAIYVYSRTGTTWETNDYIKSSNTDSYDSFGTSVCISDDGTQIVVGGFGEDSNATGVGGNQSDNSVSNSGAVYIVE